eukprot:936465-Amphidinium_carterae.1
MDVNVRANVMCKTYLTWCVIRELDVGGFGWVGMRAIIFEARANRVRRVAKCVAIEACLLDHYERPAQQQRPVPIIVKKILKNSVGDPVSTYQSAFKRIPYKPYALRKGLGPYQA